MDDHANRSIAVALFVRHPVPGRVKTRLACDLGDDAACDFYRAMVADVIANVTTSGLPLYLFHDGHESLGLPNAWLDAAEGVVGQAGDSLGERMTAAFKFLFSIGRERVILMGSDIPGIDAALIQSAITAMEESDVVFSPAFDGGYCLVASRQARFNDLIFRDIPWSTSCVLAATRAACKAGGVSNALLETRQDIDTLDDIKAYCSQPSITAQITNYWLLTHGHMVSLPTR